MSGGRGASIARGAAPGVEGAKGLGPGGGWPAGRSGARGAVEGRMVSAAKRVRTFCGCGMVGRI